MKMIKNLSLCLLVLILVVSLPGNPFSSGQEQKKQEQSEAQKKRAKLYEEMYTPGEKHKHLEYFVGEWASSQKIFRGPNKEPIIRKQEISVESLFDGRFTRARIITDVEFFGKKLVGIVLTGHDNYKKKFVSVTYVNAGTDFSLMSGTLDETGEIRTDYGEFDDIESGGTYKVKAITTILSRDKYTYDYYYYDTDGKEIHAMEITYFRKNKK